MFHKYKGQSQILLSKAPKLRNLIDGERLMLQISLAKTSKNATSVALFLYNNGIIVQRTDVNTIIFLHDYLRSE